MAFLALALAALLARADFEGVLSLAAVGHFLWAVTLAWAAGPRGQEHTPSRCLVSAATFGALGAAEALGAWCCWTAADPDMTLWFVLGLSFALAGMVTAARQEPGDSAFVAQLMFHGLILVPLISIVAQGTLTAQATLRGSRGVVSTGTPLLRTAVLVGSIAVPCLIATLVASLAINLGQPKTGRRAAWNALAANEAALIVILSRWALTLP